MRQVAALIFDLDGTLVDSAQDIANSLNYTLRSFGLPEKTKPEVQGFVGDGVKALLTKATGNCDDSFLEKAIGTFKPHYLQHCLETTVLYPGVTEMLDFFQGKKMGLVSNKPYEMVRKTLRHFSLAERFQIVLGGESVSERKPHPEPVLKSLEFLGVPPAAAIIVGDGSADIQAGKSAGTLTCAVTYGYRDKMELVNLKPDFVIDQIADLKKIVF